MIYYHKSRSDGLSKRHTTIDELTDYFIDHDDFLESRKVIFGFQTKRFSLDDKITQRPIIVIIFKHQLPHHDFFFLTVNH
jgi:hypothetical protein